MRSHRETIAGVAVAEPEMASGPRRQEMLCDLSVIIVNYNVREFLRQCLLSLRKALAGLSAEIFVVDNASIDGSVEMIRREFPEVKLIAKRENVGFARANNQALQQARGRLLMLLNPDTVVQEDTFVAIRDFMEAHPDTGMVGCKVLNPDGTLQLACRRSFPTPWVAFTRLSGLSQFFPKSRCFGRYNLTYLPDDETYEVEAISGSFMVVRREALVHVGLLDEDFFLYGEDLEWCYRMRAAGWRIHYFPGTQIIHFKGESAKQSGFDNWRLFYQAKGLFVRKHFRPDSSFGISKGRSKLFLISYWFLHLAIWLRAALTLGQSLARKAMAPTVDLALMQLNLLIAV
jgi:GT2 family glycosyltransferase